MDASPETDLIDRLAAGWRAWAIVALVALIAGLPGLARLPVMDRDEARYAQATTQMLETGDYVRINVQDTERNKKPIGIHWMQAASVALLSDAEARAIWAYRIPSLLGAILAACATFWAGLAFFPRRTAFIGATLFGAGMLLGFEAMTAKTDAMLVGLTTLTLAALAHIYARRESGSAPPRWLLLVFWIAMGVGILVKGPITPMVVGFTLLPLFAWERRAAWMKPLLWRWGLVIAALIVLPWMIAIGVATQGRFFAEAIGVDMAPKMLGGVESHGNPPGYYLVALPLLLFPATFLLPAATRLIWRTARTPRSDDAASGARFLIAWAAPTFLMFELLPTKLAHYTLPTYPALALLGAAALVLAVQERWRITQWIGYGLFALAAAGFVAVTAYASTYMPGDSTADARRLIQTVMVGAVTGLPALAALIYFRSHAVKLAVALAAAFVAAYGLRERVLPEARMLLTSHETALRLSNAGLNPRLSPGAPPIWVVGYGEASLVFETATSVQLAGAVEAAQGAAAGDTMIVEQRAYDELEALLAARGLSLESAGAASAGLNYANGDDIVLTINRVADQGV